MMKCPMKATIEAPQWAVESLILANRL